MGFDARPQCGPKALGFGDVEQMRAAMGKPQAVRDAEEEAFRGEVAEELRESGKVAKHAFRVACVSAAFALGAFIVAVIGLFR